MKYQMVAAAGAALVPLAVAVPFQQPHLRHAHLHNEKRDVQTKIDWEYVTEVVTVTAGAAQQQWENHGHPWHKHSSSSSASAAEPTTTSSSSATSSSSSYSSSSSSSSAASTTTEAAPTTSSKAASTTYVPTTSSSSSWSKESSSSTADPTYAASSSSAAAPSSSSSTVEVKAPATSTSSSAGSYSTGITKSNLTPNGRKAGLSGYIGIQNTTAFSDLADYISWYSDYTPNTPDTSGVKGIGMLWGADGSSCGDVTPERLTTFNRLATDDVVPEIMFGFYEPDCTCDMSSDMSTSAGTAQWNSLIAPLAQKGTVLGSPSMCKQKDEDWLTPFKEAGLDADWDVTSIHINKPSIDGVIEDIEYYVSTYNKPVWVTEFACVDDKNGFVACTDQTQIDDYINQAVKYFEGNSSVVAYGPSNGDGLGTVWPLTKDGELTASGKTYLNAIKNL